MKFDLFDAITQMKSKFGRDCEILIHHHCDNAMCIRLSAYRNNINYSSEFCINEDDMVGDDKLRFMNLKFKQSLFEVKRQLELGGHAV